MMTVQAQISKDDLQKAIEHVTPSKKEKKTIENKALSYEDLETLYSLGYHLYQIGDYPQARNFFEQLVISKPLEKKHWLGLASTLQVERSFNQALTGWSIVAILDPTDPLPHFHAAECLLSLDQVEQALKALEVAQTHAQVCDDQELLKKIEVLASRWQEQEEEVHGTD